jgi:hypothetical protein
MDEEDKNLLLQYRKQVEWLMERVPRDDIYDFAQQMVISAQCILAELGKHANVQKLMDKDPVLRQWVDNVMSIHFMKESGFTGIINTSISVRKP